MFPSEPMVMQIYDSHPNAGISHRARIAEVTKADFNVLPGGHTQCPLGLAPWSIGGFPRSFLATRRLMLTKVGARA